MPKKRVRNQAEFDVLTAHLTQLDMAVLACLDTFAFVRSAEGTDPYISIHTWLYLMQGKMQCTQEELERVAEKLEQLELASWIPSRDFHPAHTKTHTVANKVWGATEKAHAFVKYAVKERLI